MLTIAYIGFGVSVREYHIPYVEGREDIRVKYVFRRAEDAPQFAETWTGSSTTRRSVWWWSTPPTSSMCPTPYRF